MTDQSLPTSGEVTEAECDHDWKWVSDWYGDDNVINGTCDCSGWVCQKCGSTDNEDPRPDDDPDPDDYRERDYD